MDMDGTKKTVQEGRKNVPYVVYKDPQWYELYFDALKEQKGFILAGFGLLKPEHAKNYPPTSIIPPSIPSKLSIVGIGIRDLIDSINIVPLKRLSLKFDVSGDSHEAMESNKHPVRYNSCNIGEILKVDIDLPLNPLFSPVLSVYVYDHVLGILGTRMIGICHIPLCNLAKKTLRALLERKKRMYGDEGYNDPVRIFEATDAKLEKKNKPKTIEIDPEEEAKLNESLNLLEVMIDKGEIDLDDDTSSNATLEEAIDDAWNDIEEQEKKNKERSDLGNRESDYHLDSTIQEMFEGEESEEDIDDSEEDTERYSSNTIEESSKNRESTVRSNDIALGFDEEDSEEEGEGDENENDEEEEEVHDVDKQSLVKSNKSGVNKSQRSNKSKKAHKKNQNASISNSFKNERPTRGLRYSITEPRINNTRDRKFIPREETKNLEKQKSKRKHKDKDSSNGLLAKKEIERRLRGYELKKDKMKKVVQQKILQKKFKEDIKYREEQDKQSRDKAREERHKGVKNQEKRLKLKTRENKKVSTPCELTDPEEDLEMVPEYLRGRDTYEDELEDRLIIKKPFYRVNILNGQTRGVKGWFFKKVVNTQSITGIFKCINLIQMPDDDPEDLYRDYKQFLEPTNLVCRVYILKGKSLTPNDTKNSDPYLYIKCGSHVIDDEKNVIEDTNNPGFYKHFDIPVSIPGASTLKIEVWDDDGIVGDDLIGETRIDLEERWFSKEWRALNDSSIKNALKENTEGPKSKKSSESKNDQETVDKSTKGGMSNKDENEEEKAKDFDDKESSVFMKVPIEERTLVKKTSAAPQGILE